MALNDGITQYKEWQRAGPISSSVLTARPAALVELGVMDRARYTSHPPGTSTGSRCAAGGCGRTC